MRIQNNVTAMNTHRMYTMNNDAVAASAKKLSSGYRINSAADDAAGLAISEKMRSQIRGLNMATKNSQDAISLVQTAEGALQETQNMLQRMNELAVQAATGTNEDLDRTALAKEFEQLKREINDVAEQTNFNNMKILDGSLSYNGYVRSAQTAGVNATVETNATTLDPAITIESKNATPASGGQAAEITYADASFKDLVLDENKNYQLQMQVGNKTYDFKLNGQDAILTDKDNVKAGAAFNGATVTVEVDGKNVDFSIDTNGKLSTTDKVDFDWNDVKLNLTEIDPATGARTEKATLTAADRKAAGDLKNGVAERTGDNVAEQTIKIDQSKLSDGDSITIGGKTYTFYAGEEKRDATGAQVKGTTSAGTLYGAGNTVYEAKAEDGSTISSSELTDGGKNVTIVYNGKDANSAATLLANALAGNATGVGGASASTGTAVTNPAQVAATASDAGYAAGSVNVTRSGDTVTIKATAGTVAGATGTVDNAEELKYGASQKAVDAANDSIAAKFTGASNSKESTRTTVEFDVAKMKDGDTFTIKAGSQKLEVTYSKDDTRAGFMKKVAEAAEKAGFGTVKGNALIVDDYKVDIKLDEKWQEESYAKDTNALRIQVGALENEQLMISIDSMNTAGLKLDDVALTDLYGKFAGDDQDAAGDAITKTRDAINKISDQRATLGAMQNRLDHKIANLKTTAENLTASESRIRDVDMAEEMTNFTKNNILSQAATAMLAQANSLPQNVLSLLG